MSNNTFSVALPLTGEYLTTVRLTVGGLCLIADFDVDSTEDVKVCVTECLLILKRNGFIRAEIDFTVGETLAVRVKGVGDVAVEDDNPENEISYALLEALLGDSLKVETVARCNKALSLSFEG
ncbi:MAG: hypothetical protein IJB97_10500 [Clostridia bacterium]|nr:hypothetical protein [Clostridia bacterium]